MNCAYCGGPIKLEEEYCPHCGKPNIQAQAHSRDMAAYKNEFEKTRHGVYRRLSTYKGITVRLIIFVIAVIVMIVAFVLFQGTYSIHRNRMVSYNLAHVDEVSAQVEEYLEHNDYVGLAAYAEYRYLTNYRMEDSPLGVYYPIIRISTGYSYLYNDLITLYCSTDPENEYSRRSIGADVEDLYEYLIHPEKKYMEEYMDDENVKKATADIMIQADALLKTYLGFNDEEIEQIHTLSGARRTILVEEHLDTLIESRN